MARRFWREQNKNEIFNLLLGQRSGLGLASGVSWNKLSGAAWSVWNKFIYQISCTTMMHKTISARTCEYDLSVPRSYALRIASFYL